MLLRETLKTYSLSFELPLVHAFKCYLPQGVHRVLLVLELLLMLLFGHLGVRDFRLCGY